MNERTPSQDEALADAMRDEARRASPAFSDALHGRIMAAVREARPGVDGGRRGAGVALRWAAVVGLAAAIAAAVAWMGRGRPTPVAEAPPPVRTAVDPVHPGALVRAIEGVLAPADRLTPELQSRQFAYLDEDGRRLARFMLDRVAVGFPVPASEAATP